MPQVQMFSQRKPTPFFQSDTQIKEHPTLQQQTFYRFDNTLI